MTLSRWPTLALSTLSVACAHPTPDSTCLGAEPVTDRYLEVTASILEAVWGDDGMPVIGERIEQECATFSVTRPDSEWQVVGQTPGFVDLAPGDYVLEAVSTVGTLGFASDALNVELDDVARAVDLPLCVDLSGPWVCEDDEGFAEIEATMVDGCRVALDGLGVSADVDGLMLEAGDREGVVAPEGDLFKLRSMSGAAEWTACWR